MAKNPGREPTDAIDLLLQDHRKVEDLFKQFDKLSEDDEEAANVVIETACVELTVHDKLEVEIFYPAVREAADDEMDDVLDEAEVEHEGVRELIEKLEAMELDDEKRKARFTVLTEYVKHHVKEEETEMFPKVKKLEGLDLGALGEQMAKRKAELMEEATTA
ncbi:MAG: hemerythrin domain-containing protein [Burkholderiales bacterium]